MISITPATKTTLIRLGAVLAVYLALVFLAGRFGRAIVWPVNIFVTTLHELGHALGGLITGGKVEHVQVNADGSGQASILGGNIPIILMGGYIGSAVFGNILFYIGVRAGTLARSTLFIIGLFFIFSAFIWYAHIFSSLVQIFMGALLIGFAVKKWIMRETLMFLGLASLIYIIQDFNGGPTSDLATYTRRMGFFSFNIWMLIWLGIVLAMTYFNIRLIIRKDKAPKPKETKPPKPVA